MAVAVIPLVIILVLLAGCVALCTRHTIQDHRNSKKAREIMLTTIQEPQQQEPSPPDEDEAAPAYDTLYPSSQPYQPETRPYQPETQQQLPSYDSDNSRATTMSNNHHDDDFGPNISDGYKPGQKKTIDEYKNLDAGDDSLNRWKESLGVTTASGSDDPHNVVVLQLALEVAGRPDVVLDLTQSAEDLKKHSFTIKEGVEYRTKVLFKVQHSLVSGLKYLQVVKRMNVPGNDEMIGSYAASPNVIEKKASDFFTLEDAPSGMMARGHYEVKSKFVDDDGTVHKQWAWSFDIKKDW
ncbi:hypothetical protein BGZ76_003275 [Entomortierella beljakovae]|nr:hypothetical protein BGZ76_003275 [Entomortierella beljakovae]